MEEILDNDAVALSANTPEITKEKGIFRFSKLNEEELTQKVQSFLSKKGYNLEEGQANNGKYGKGSRIGRILLGAFIKRFAWRVTVHQNGNLAELTFFKEAKGYVGGAIGVAQVNKEFNSIIDSLKTFHSKLES